MLVSRDRIPRRRGGVAVEFALVLPLLVFLFVVAVDYSRIFHFAQVVNQCARNGALYYSDPYAAAQSHYNSGEEAAKADAPEPLKSQLTVDPPQYETVSGVKEVVVTVRYPFTTLTQYPGVPHQVTLTRTVRMPVAPETPQ